MAVNEKALSTLLAHLNEIEGVRGSALVTRDGLPYDIQIPGALNDEVLAAMTATILGAAETALYELGEQEADRITIRGGNRGILVTPMGHDFLLVVALTDPGQMDAVYDRARDHLGSR